MGQLPWPSSSFPSRPNSPQTSSSCAYFFHLEYFMPRFSPNWLLPAFWSPHTIPISERPSWPTDLKQLPSSLPHPSYLSRGPQTFSEEGQFSEYPKYCGFHSPHNPCHNSQLCLCNMRPVTDDTSTKVRLCLNNTIFMDPDFGISDNFQVSNILWIFSSHLKI